MRFLHTSDLHIGKTVNGFSMLKEQEHVLAQILAYAKEYQVRAVLLSGDLYDRSVPPSQAVSLLDDFLTELIREEITVLAIAGNHDSGERIGFASRILEKRGLHMEGLCGETVKYVDLEDETGLVRFHLLPFARPAQVRALYGIQADSYEACIREQMNHIQYAKQGANVLLAHHFVVNRGQEPELSDSETRVSVGGTDQVEAENFSRFDYVALGHIHGGQQIGDRPVYYSGSPVKYSFSEVHHEKAVVLVEIDGQKTVEVTRLPLSPIHDMRKIRGKLADLISPAVAEAADEEDYILAVLTDDGELADPMGTLRSVYPNVMQLQWERKTVNFEETERSLETIREKSPLELFEDFFEQVMGKSLTEEQREIMKQTIETAGEESE